MTSQRNPIGAFAHIADTPAPQIDECIEAELGNKLREAFSDVFNEPVPQRLRQLIDALTARGRQ